MNKWIGMGRLTRDPQVSYSGETAIARTSVAINRRFKNKEGNYDADFINVSAFGKTAEFLEKYFHKGDMIAIVGRITTGSYEKDGQRVYTTEVTIEEIEFAGGKSDGAQTAAPAQTSSGNNFMNIPDGSTDELPFN